MVLWQINGPISALSALYLAQRFIVKPNGVVYIKHLACGKISFSISQESLTYQPCLCYDDISEKVDSLTITDNRNLIWLEVSLSHN